MSLQKKDTKRNVGKKSLRGSPKKKTANPDSRSKNHWASRIVRSGKVDPKDIKLNPYNWRTHPEVQKDAMLAVLNEIGWVQDIIVNQTTGNLLDGHLRVELALERKERQVPVKFVAISRKEEKLFLSTYDPLSTLAGADSDVLERLLDQVKSDDEDIQKLLLKVANDGGVETFVPESDQNIEEWRERFDILVECDNESHQKEVLSMLERKGISCRALIS